MKLKIRCLSTETSRLYANHGTHHAGDSGLDLFTPQETVVKAGQTCMLRLGIQASAWQRGENVSFLVLPRSSISKTPLRLANSIGLIDSGYRGELIAAVDNIKAEDYTVKKGERLVQAVSFTGEEIEFELVDSLDDNTSRGERGFGSTNNEVKPSPIDSEKKKPSPIDSEKKKPSPIDSEKKKPSPIDSEKKNTQDIQPLDSTTSSGNQWMGE